MKEKRRPIKASAVNAAALKLKARSYLSIIVLSVLLVVGCFALYNSDEIAEQDANDAAWAAGTVDRAWERVRTKRDQLLKNSDFTQLDDSPKNKVAWKTYRQALRDITDQPDPDNITWPVEP